MGAVPLGADFAHIWQGGAPWKTKKGKTEWGIKEGVVGKEALVGNQSRKEEGCWERTGEEKCKSPNNIREGLGQKKNLRWSSVTETETQEKNTTGEGDAIHSEDQMNMLESMLPYLYRAGDAEPGNFLQNK